jgi:Domain of unknown function (DUF4037)
VGVSGVALSRVYYHELVGPAIGARWPGLPHAAGRLGSGSDILKFDDAVSRDHDFGLRLNLLVPRDVAGQVDAHLDTVLPDRFAGYPTRFAVTWDQQVRHRVQVEDVGTFVASRTGITACDSLSVADWLVLTGQAVLEVTAGPVFVDTAGELTAVRGRLDWYPDDLWAYVVATDWARIAQELPFVGRAAERGDDLGSRVIASRLADVAMHLAHLLERRWPPYAKWTGTSLSRLPFARPAAESLSRALEAGDWQTREGGLVDAMRTLHERQRQVGLPTVDDPVELFWGRRYRGIRADVVTRLEDSITDRVVRALPRGVGSAEQWSHNVAVLADPSRRLPSHADGDAPDSARLAQDDST